MASNNAFTNQGAVPSNPFSSSLTPNYGSGPFSSALSRATSGNLGSNTNFRLPANSGISISPQSQTTPNQPVGGALASMTQPITSGLINPITPVKSHTVNNVDGSSVTQTYHTPAAPAATPAAPQNQGFGTSTGGVNSGQSGSQSQSPQQSTPFQSNVNTLTNQGTTPNPAASTATSGLLNTQQNGNPQAAAQSGLMNIAQNGSPAVQQAQQNVQGLQQAQSEIANNPNVASEVASGRGQALTGQIQAGETALQNALSQQNQQITAGNEAGQLGLTNQGQQISAGSAAGSTANTSQSNQISAATSGANVTQPQLGQYGQAYYNPTTGQAVGGQNAGGALNPLNNISSLAQQVISGQLSPSDAYAMGGSIPNFQGALNAAIKQINPNFNTATAQGRYEANQQNTTTTGTATTQANSSGLQGSIQQEQTLNTAASAAQSLSTQVQEALQNSGLNLTNSADANTAINNLSSRLGNAAYTQLNIAVNDARTAYGQILTSMGTTPTDAGNLADQNINANMSPAQILSAINQLNQGVYARQSAVHQQTQSYAGNLGIGGGSSQSAPATSGKTSSGISWTIVQ